MNAGSRRGRTTNGGRGEREGPAEQKRAEARRCGPGSLAMAQRLDAAVSQKLGRRRRIGGGKLGTSTGQRTASRIGSIGPRRRVWRSGRVYSSGQRVSCLGRMRAARDNQGWLGLAPASHVEPGAGGPGLVAVRAVAAWPSACALVVSMGSADVVDLAQRRRVKRASSRATAQDSGLLLVRKMRQRVAAWLYMDIDSARSRPPMRRGVASCLAVARMTARISTVSAAQRRSAQQLGSCRWVAGYPGRSLPHGHDSPSPCIVRFRNGRPSKKLGRM